MSLPAYAQVPQTTQGPSTQPFSNPLFGTGSAQVIDQGGLIDYATPDNMVASTSFRPTQVDTRTSASGTLDQVYPHDSYDIPSYSDYERSWTPDLLVPFLDKEVWTSLMNGQWVGLAAKQCYIQHLSSYRFRDWWEEDKRDKSVDSQDPKEEFNFFLPWHWEFGEGPGLWDFFPNGSVQFKQDFL